MAAKTTPPKNRMTNWVRLGLFWAIIVVAILALFAVVSPHEQLKDVPISDVIKRANEGQISQIEIQGTDVKVTPKGQSKATEHSMKEGSSSIYEQGLKQDSGTQVNVVPPSQTGETLWNLAIIVVPVILIAAFFMFMMRQAQGQNNQALGFGKSKAKLYGVDKEKVVFDDIAGNDNAKQDLEEVVDFLKHPKKYQEVGAKIPKGVLLVGSPGTGKTMLARAVAGEASVPFFSISGSEFVEMFVGVGASRVRDLFAKAKKNAPAIIFIDEIDAVGRRRGSGMGGGHDEREQTLNQLLVEMDGFESNEGVILMAATNRPDVLDPALLRPGRFDRRVVVSRPDVRGREEILRVHARRIPLAPNVELKVLARGTPGFSGADLANLVNESALLAARQNKKLVEMTDFENAKDKVLMGVERRSMIISDQENRTIAYHEAGHALVAYFLPGADPLHKVTIIPRGRALGLTMQLPMDDKYSYSKEFLINRITILLGGRTAEELVLQQQTTGAGDDLEKATEMARKMVCEWGMSDRLGPLTFGKNEEHIFLGREVARAKDYSEETALAIDSEIKRIVVECAARARQILEENIEKLHALARALL